MYQTFVAITLLTLGAALLVALLQRVKVSPVLGYIVLGMLASPFQNHLFQTPEGFDLVAELALVLLMFFIGLEFHLEDVRAQLKAFVAGGTLQVVLTAGAAGGIAWALGSSIQAGLVIGLMLAFSSTALVLKAFEEQRQMDSQRCRVALSILLFQDIAAILAVAVLPLLAPKAGATTTGALPSIVGVPQPVFRLGLLLVVLPLLFAGSRYLLPRVFHGAAARAPESFSLVSLGACLSVALAAQLAGASAALGAFLGGLVLCRTPFASQILADLSTLRNLALAFFFVTIGMLVDLRFAWSHGLWLLAALAGVVVVKWLCTAATLAILRIPAAVAAGVALVLAQVGEFSFVIGREAAASGVLTGNDYQFVLALAVLSMLLTPLLVGRSASFGNRVAIWLGSVSTEAHGSVAGENREGGPRAIVVGYGPVGRTLTRILKDFGVQPTIVDMNIDTVKKLSASGYAAVFGDAGRREILRAAGVEHAAYLLVTLPDLPGRIPVVATARIMNAEIKILTRARYLGERAMLEEAGASAVGYEEAEVAAALAGFLLKEIGAGEAEITQEIERIRGELAVRPERGD